MENATIKYFGYGSNRNLEMMQHMVGRDNLECTPAKMPGYELCIQKVSDIPDVIAPGSPTQESPRQIVSNAFDPDFELYIIRPNPQAEAYGVIWYLTPDELKLVHEWELLDFGMQEVIKGEAIDDQGNVIAVDTHGTLNANAPINRVITGNDYDDYIISKEEILKVADRVRKAYLEREPVASN